MADLEETSEGSRIAEEKRSKHEDERDASHQNGKKRKWYLLLHPDIRDAEHFILRSRKRRNSGKSEGSAQASSSVHKFAPEEMREEGKDKEQNVRRRWTGGFSVTSDRNVLEMFCSPRQDTLPPQEDYQARFYENYRRVADEYDKDFLKKYEEDLDTTLIFAGLFSAVASDFIVQVDSQLQPDPDADTTALLRVLIYKIDNTTFGSDVPTLPQWTGSSPAMFHVCDARQTVIEPLRLGTPSLTLPTRHNFPRHSRLPSRASHS